MAPPRSTDAPPGPAGVAIDQAAPPAYLARYLSERQLKNEVGLQWATALEMAPGYTPADRAVANTVWKKTIGKVLKKAWPTVRQIMVATGIGSPNTVVRALRRLVGDGWLLREVRAAQSRRLAPERPGQAGVGYRLAWPLVDCIGAPLDGGPERCGEETTKGGLCTTRAGKGTTHRGRGPCWRHGGERANPPEDAPPAASPGNTAAQAPEQPAAETVEQPHAEGRPTLQVVQHPNASPVDNPSIQLPLLQPLQGGMLQRLQLNASTDEGGMLQRLRRNASTGVTEGASKELDQGANEGTRGSDVLGAELEGGPHRSPDGTFEAAPQEEHGHQLSIDQAHEILDDLTEPMLAYSMSRAAFDLRRAGHPSPTPDELVLAAAAAILRKRTA
jgi:hypothetical protein